MSARIQPGTVSGGMMADQLRFGMVPTPLTAPYDEVLARSRHAVELGFDGLWFADETPMAYPDESAMDADIWNTLGGEPIEGEARRLDDAIDATRRQVEQLDAACLEIGRDPASIRGSVFAFRVDVYSSIGAFEEWVGRMLEIGLREFLVNSPVEDRAGEALLERFATDSMPRLRAAVA